MYESRSSVAMMSMASRPSRAALSLVANTNDDRDVTLSSLIDALRKSQIAGPFQLTECHLGAKPLGVGAQFEVFGKRVFVESTFFDFDRPYLNEPTKCFVELKTQYIDHRFEYVALKRPKFRASEAASGLVRLSTRGFEQTVSRSQLHQAYLEVLVLCHAPLRRHKNIVKLLAWGYDCPANDVRMFSPVLLVECALCTLEELSMRAEIPWAIKQHLCAGAANGVAALHECFIVHGDIKPANVLVFASHTAPYSCLAKVSDFGLCIHETGISTETPRGTLGWSSPELQEHVEVKRDELPKCDIWSLGLTIWSVMLERAAVIDELSIQSSTLTLVKRLDTLETPIKLRMVLQRALNQMLVISPALRCVTAASVFEMITSVDIVVDDDELTRFLTLFEESSDWEAIEKKSLSSPPLLRGAGDWPTATVKALRATQRDWQHNMARSLQLVDRDHLILGQLSVEETPLPELFDVAMAFAIAESRNDELTALERCAQSGYIPAQALYHAVAAAVLPKRDVLTTQTQVDWMINAVASGFLFAPAWFRLTESAAYDAAKSSFRNAGGYNMTRLQCSTQTSGQTNQAGLHVDEELMDGLKEHPLHFLAGFDILEAQSISSWKHDLNAFDHVGDTPLLKCCKAGRIENLRALAKQRPDASLTNKFQGIGALHWLFVFAEENINEAAALLSNLGADPQHCITSVVESAHFPFAWPSGAPLHWATFANNHTSVRALIAQGADIDQEDAARQTSLCIALRMRSVDMVELLISLGAVPRTNIALAPKSDREELVPDQDREDLRTPIHTFLNTVLNVGTDPDMDGFEDMIVYIPPRHDEYIFMDNEARSRTQNILRVLIQHWRDCFKWRDSVDMTPVHCYVMHTSIDTVILDSLMAVGSDLDDLVSGQMSILALLFQFHSGSCREEDDKYLQSFVARFVGSVMSKGRRIAFLNRKEPLHPGINPGCHDHRPLHFTAELGLPACAQTLLELDADPTIRKENGKTPADLAKDALALKRHPRSDRENLTMWDNAASDWTRDKYEKLQEGYHSTRNEGRQQCLRILEGWKAG